MDFYELKNKYFSLVRKKMINDYKMGNIDFMESEELLDHIIERIGVYQDHGKSDDESIASAFRDFHGKLLALRPLTLGYTVGSQRSREQNMCQYFEGWLAQSLRMKAWRQSLRNEME